MWVECLSVVVVLVILLIMNRENFKNFWGKDVNVFNMYFDANGTTPPHKEVVEIVRKTSYVGNPSSSYSSYAKDIIQNLKNSIHNHTNTSPDTHEIILTSGASESNNLLIRGLVDDYWMKFPKSNVLPNIILSTVEHKTSILCAEQLAKLGRCEVNFVNVDPDCTVNPDNVNKLINANTILVSIMHANNETGSKNDISRIGEICAKRNITFHSDVVQTFGKYPIQMNLWKVNAISMSFHKMNGPNGIGILCVSKSSIPLAQICGTQNNNIRGGTENTPAAAGALIAMNVTLANRFNKNARLADFKKQIINCISSYCGVVHFNEFVGKSDAFRAEGIIPQQGKKLMAVFLGPVGSSGFPVDSSSAVSGSQPNTILVSFVKPWSENYKNFCNLKLKKALQDEGVIVSIGSACNTEVSGPSHVLKALNAPFIIRCGVIRISLGDHNTQSEVKKLCDILKKHTLAQV